MRGSHLPLRDGFMLQGPAFRQFRGGGPRDLPGPPFPNSEAQPPFLIMTKQIHTLAEYDVRGAQFQPTQLVLESGLPEEDWQEVGRAIVRVNQASHFWIGDWIEYGRKLYGIQTCYDLAAQATNLSRGTLQEYARLARQYAPPDRFPSLSFGHHKALSKFPAQARTKLLAEATELGLTAKQARTLAENECGKPGKQRDGAHRRSVIIKLWSETIERLQEMRGKTELSFFVARIIEDWLRWKGVEDFEPDFIRDARKVQQAGRIARGLCATCGVNPIDTTGLRYPERDAKRTNTCAACRAKKRNWDKWDRHERILPDGATLAASAHS